MSDLLLAVVAGSLFASVIITAEVILANVRFLDDINRF